MSRNEHRIPWLAKAEDLGQYLAAKATTAEPLCFMIGAGASLSSGAPLTAKLIERFDALLDGRLDGFSAEERRRAIDRITEDEKRAAIRDLFFDDDERQTIRPYVGYRCLAAMGREHRVYVLNFNWDLAVEDACKTLTVPCTSVSLDEDPATVLAALEGSEPGIVCVHVHGQWDRGVPLRYGTLETLSFTDWQQELLVEHVFGHTTILAGLSLADDLNTHELLIRLCGQKVPATALRPLWVFYRGSGPPPAAAAIVDELLHAKRSCANFVPGERLDFDRLMVTLRAAQAGLSYEDIRRDPAGAVLPALDDTVWPSPSLLRDRLDEPVLALVGEEKLGKSTAAHLLAFWRLLWKPQTAGAVKTLRGTAGGLEALTTASAAAGQEASRQLQLVVEDPFGQENVDPNPSFLPALKRVLDAGATGVIITSRLHNWDVGFDEAEEAILPQRAVVEEDAGSWYTVGDLVRHLERLGPLEVAAFREEVLRRELNTPARVDARVAGWTPRQGDPGNVRDKAALVARLFDHADRRPMALAVVLVRLQEVSEVTQTRAELLALAGQIDEVPAWRRLRSMLFEFDMDGRSRLKLRHSTDRQAVDGFLRERIADARAALDDLGSPAGWARDALVAWVALEAVRHEEHWDPASVPAATRRTWAGPLVEQATMHSVERGWATISALVDDRSAVDFWALCEGVYEAMRLWTLLSDDRKQADAFIVAVLADRERMGAYALLEATLYLQHVTPPEIWTRLQSAIVGLSREEDTEPLVDFELGLLFDGLVWRPPAVPDETLRQLFRALLDAADKRPRLAGAYALACAYHDAGAAFLRSRPDLSDPSERLDRLTAEQAAEAARIVRFHFAHQSRARVALARRPFEGCAIDYLLQTFYRERLNEGLGERLTRLAERLAEHDHAGWGVHLILNVGVTHGKLSDAHLRRVAALVPATDGAGLLTAAMSYELPGEIRRALSAWFNWEPARRDAALDILCDGITIDGWRVDPPRFRFVRDLADLWDLLRCNWTRLHNVADVKTHEPDALAVAYQDAAEPAVARGVDRALVATLVDRARRGDLRIFETAAAARGGDDPHVRSLMAAARLFAQLDGQDKLF